MLKLHFKMTCPEPGSLFPTDPEFDGFVEILNSQTAHLLEGAPVVDSDTPGLSATRTDLVDSLANIRELCILRNQWATVDYPQIGEFRATNNVTKEIRIEDTTTDSIVLDWTTIPRLAQNEFVTWANATIV
jgi:hypothetical protein